MATTLTLDAEATRWLQSLSDEALADEVGFGPLSRGQAYASQGKVQRVMTVDNGRTLVARVAGSRNVTYNTVVRLGNPSDQFSAEVIGYCSCPVALDCKHVAAVILYARQHVRRQHRQEQSGTSWRALLDGLTPEPRLGKGAPLGLQFVLRRSPGTPWTTSRQAPSLALRPVTPGKRSGWIKSGVGWAQLTPHRARPGDRRPLLAEHLEALLAIQAVGAGGSFAYVHEGLLPLADLGPSAWHLIHQAAAAGVALLDDATRPGPVTLSDIPARLTLTSWSQEGDAVLDPGIDHDDEPVDLTGITWIGSPPFGLARRTGPQDGLQLVQLERALTTQEFALVQHGPVRVPRDDVPTLRRQYLPRLAERMHLRSTDTELRPPTVAGPYLGVQVTHQPAHRTDLVCHWVYEVDGEPVEVPVQADAPASAVPRDPLAEAALVEALGYLEAVPGLTLPGLRLPGGQLVSEQTHLTGLQTVTFLDRVLPELLADERVRLHVHGPTPDYRQAQEAPLIRVSATDSSDPGRTDWFDLDVQVSIDGEDVDFAALFRALAAGSDHLILDSGLWFSLDRPEFVSLRALIEEARALQEPDTPGLSLTPLHAGLWEELIALGVVGEQSDRWARSVSALLELEASPAPPLPSGLQAELRPYQQHGYAWLSLLWDNGLGGILADDMGLGKTVQTLAMAARAHEQGHLDASAGGGPLLIVCPTSVIGSWVEQAQRFTPQLRIAAVTETQARRAVPLEVMAADADIILTSYTLVRLEQEDYQAIAWSGVILDEAQAVKNHHAKTYQAVRRLPGRCKVAITGTPLENSLMDLWSLLSISAPGLYPDPVAFTEEYRRPIEAGDAERLARLRRRIRPLMLRRTKQEVAPELPPKQEQVLHVELNPAHRRTYSKHLQRERQRVLGLLDDVQKNRVAIFRSLTVLRQLSLAPVLVDPDYARISASKLDVLMEQVRAVVAEGHRALVFSQFTGFLGLVKARLDAESIGYSYLDGRTRDRATRIEQFRQGDDPLFLISLKAGGFGLTLTEADYVFILDPWWNPAAEEQAIDRTHRIGQTKTVMVYRLVATNTIEDKVVALQERKRRLFDDVVGSGESFSAPLTAEDIRGLLEH
ncbi:MAG: SNF2-related protein [Actinomycetales bacterium]